jgi:deoxyadenosine/deoxycytidine kinase
MKVQIIALVGGVGVGKSHWGHLLTNRLSFSQFIEEDVSNNLYLNEYYLDKKKWGFHSRISMLSMVTANMSRALSKCEYVIYDRCVHELIVFAKREYEDGNLTEKEFKLYCQLYNAITTALAQPDLYIYFYCSPETALKRIHQRARECEKKIDLRFCCDVLERYDSWRRTLSEKTVIDLNTDLDIGLNELVEKIMSRLGEKNSYA